MKASAVATAFLSLIPLLAGLGGVADGGNVDFYRCPLSIAWFLLTAYSVCSQNYSSLIAFIRRAWGLQLVMPLVLFALSLGLEGIYQPYPLINESMLRLTLHRKTPPNRTSCRELLDHLA